MAFPGFSHIYGWFAGSLNMLGGRQGISEGTQKKLKWIFKKPIRTVNKLGSTAKEDEAMDMGTWKGSEQKWKGPPSGREARANGGAESMKVRVDFEDG